MSLILWFWISEMVGTSYPLYPNQSCFMIFSHNSKLKPKPCSWPVTAGWHYGSVPPNLTWHPLSGHREWTKCEATYKVTGSSHQPTSSSKAPEPFQQHHQLEATVHKLSLPPLPSTKWVVQAGLKLVILLLCLLHQILPACATTETWAVGNTLYPNRV